MSDLHPGRECATQCGICDKSLGARRRMHIPQDPKERMLWAVKEYNVPQDTCICANCALQIKLGYQEPTTLYEPSKEDDSAASEEEPEYDATEEEVHMKPTKHIQSPRGVPQILHPHPQKYNTPNKLGAVQIRNNLPPNTCYLGRYTLCNDSAMWNVAAPDWGSFSATFHLDRYKEEELPHNFSLCHAHYCQHTAFKIPKCALCQKKTTILRTNGQLFMKAFKLTPAMEKYCRSNKVKIVVTEATRLCTRCYQRVGQQVNNPKKAILPKSNNTAVRAANNEDDEIQILSVKRKQPSTTTPNNVKNSSSPKVVAAKTGVALRPASAAKLRELTKPTGTKLDVLLVCEDEALSPEQQAPFSKYAKMKQQHSVDTSNYYKTHSVR